MTKLAAESVRFSRRLRTHMTDAERRLWHELRLRQLGVKFRRQHPVGRYFVDFACVERMLCVEVDGAQHAEQRIDYDDARTAVLKKHGYRVIRFTDREVLTAIESVKEAIWNALHSEPPPP